MRSLWTGHIAQWDEDRSSRHNVKMLKTKTTTTTKKEATPRMATWNKQDIHGKIPKFRLKTYLEPSTTQFGFFFFNLMSPFS